MQPRSPESQPLVSVIIPVWNVETYLRECLESVVGQTLAPDQIEIVAVDDGSTDHSGLIIDEYAQRFPQVKAIHQAASGGPGRPRNVGLDNATGRYIFFVDADDYLGREALDRLTAMAERNNSDIVLAKMAGVDGRTVPRGPFRRSLERATLAEVYSTLSVLKLYRRDFLEGIGCRFAEGLPFSEDAPFAQRAYFAAGVISVVGDYDCYYARLRSGSQSKSGRLRDFVAHLDRVGQRMELLGAHTEPGPDRDVLMVRHIWDVVLAFQGRWLSQDPAERRRVFDAGAALINRWHTTAMYDRLKPKMALRAYCLEKGLMAELEDIVRCDPVMAISNPIVEGKRIFARYPHFRDKAGIPDDYFDMTNMVKLRQRLLSAELRDRKLSLSGECFLSGVGGSTTIVLRRRWPKGPVHRFAVTSFPTPHVRDTTRGYPDAGFQVEVNLRQVEGARLPAGLWKILISAGTSQVRRTAPLRLGDLATASLGASRARRWLHSADLNVTDKGQLQLRVGPSFLTPAVLNRAEKAHEQLQHVRTRVRRSGRRRLRKLRSVISRQVPEASRWSFRSKDQTTEAGSAPGPRRES